MLDGRFDPAFHQAFVAGDTPDEVPVLPVPVWLPVLAWIGGLCVIVAVVMARQ